ncbi:MAG: histidinol-phosphate transaminase [Candidatus Omnitrophica bacterium]|nr:histidinol-phosphate transaminase [Candidatus Omnitrophota bacterium]MBU0895304.1 histidinol-phosphate transaminase [Candidatus Omnitrophota bacterium]MBU1809185.1 histidinol-phosphate transaminase [Candidatus Omnitrophota bacterium]
MKDRVRQSILNVSQYVPGKPIEEVRRELGLKEVIKLASNENCMGASPKAMAAIRGKVAEINRYPDSSSYYLRKKVAKFLGVDQRSLIFGNGSDEIICIAVRTFMEEGDEVVIAKPTFLIYEIVSQLQGAKIKYVALRGRLKHDLRAMKEAITDNTKMVFIANPDNPTGTYVSKKELDRFFDGLPEKVIVFLDEAYFEFADYSFKDYPNGIDYLNRPGVIVARSFSKAYGLAGLRIGYGIASPEIINYMERAREPFNVNLLAQAGAAAAIDDKAFLKKTLSHVEREKESLYAALRDMGLSYIASATNFILVDVKRDCKEIFNALLKAGIIVRDMKAWGMDTYIRVTIGTRIENKRFIKAIKGLVRTDIGRAKR